jgi:hypothetical protein
MTDTQWTIEPTDIEWTHEDKTHFEPEGAVALMLINDVIFLNNHWFEKNWPEPVRRNAALFVNCNDVFAWACADAEPLPYHQIENVYKMWCKDSEWGPAIWCMVARNQMPQKPLEKIIREAGVWNLDELNLGQNTDDAKIKELFRRLTGK